MDFPWRHEALPPTLGMYSDVGQGNDSEDSSERAAEDEGGTLEVEMLGDTRSPKAAGCEDEDDSSGSDCGSDGDKENRGRQLGSSLENAAMSDSTRDAAECLRPCFDFAARAEPISDKSAVPQTATKCRAPIARIRVTNESIRGLVDAQIPRLEAEKCRRRFQEIAGSCDDDGGDAERESGGSVVIPSVRFIEWKSVLLNGDCILLSGWGSKRRILNAFADEALLDCWRVAVKGYAPSLDFSALITRILAKAAASGGVSDDGEKPKRLNDKVKLLRRKLDDGYSFADRLIFIVHSLDAPAMDPFHEHLAVLCSSDNVSMIASVDSHNSHLIWKPKEPKEFLQIEDQNCDTFEDFREELCVFYGCDDPGDAIGRLPFWMRPLPTEALENPDADFLPNVRNSGGRGRNKKVKDEALRRQGVSIVLNSVTPHHRTVVKVLAKLQLEALALRQESHSSKFPGISQNRVLEKMQLELLLSDRTKLKKLLDELISHEVVERNKSRGEIFLKLTTTNLGRLLKDLS